MMTSGEKLSKFVLAMTSIFNELLDMPNEKLDEIFNIKKGMIYKKGMAIAGDGDEPGEHYEMEIRILKK